jgi:hypothetical protein
MLACKIGSSCVGAAMLVFWISIGGWIGLNVFFVACRIWATRDNPPEVRRLTGEILRFSKRAQH